MWVTSQSGSPKKVRITELPRLRTPMQATLILLFGFAAITDGGVPAARIVASEPADLRKSRREEGVGLMGTSLSLRRTSDNARLAVFPADIFAPFQIPKETTQLLSKTAVGKTGGAALMLRRRLR